MKNYSDYPDDSAPYSRTRRPIKKRKRLKLRLIITALLVLTIGGITIDSNTRIQVEYPVIQVAKPLGSFDGYSVAVVSDVHNKQFGRESEKLLRLISDAKPDMIAVTGDLIDGKGQIPRAVELAKKLLEIAPVYFISGNHEFATKEHRDLFQALRDIGVVVLRNQIDRIYAEGDSGEHITIVGIDDPQGPADMKTPAQVFAQLTDDDRAGLVLTLVHRNFYLRDFAPLGTDVILCGHAHGGVVRLPFLPQGIWAQTGFFPKETGGLFTYGSTSMYVSRGLGNVYGIPRFMNNPHLPVVILKGA
ncbi:MAG: metallophosphoesterase [Oscillospiraceae bacterium]|nr:metallophosphoesterase [Oscillospiraceae bacterium]